MIHNLEPRGLLQRLALRQHHLWLSKHDVGLLVQGSLPLLRTTFEDWDSCLHLSDPTIEPTNNPNTSTLPSWVKHDACVTLYLPEMDKPKRGKLIYDEESAEWKFRPGKKETNPTINLPDLEQQIHQLIQDRRIFDQYLSVTSKVLSIVTIKECPKNNLRGK